MDDTSPEMTRERALALIKVTPEYIPGPCPWCGAETENEAKSKCKPEPLYCGDYICGTPDEAPTDDDGRLYQRNPDFDRLDGYLWGWRAVDVGLTTEPPSWGEDG